VATILTPLAFLHLAVLLGIAHIWRKHKEYRRHLLWVLVPFLLLYLSNTAPIAYLALGSLEWRYPPSDEVPQDAGAIVILAGTVRTADPIRTRPELGPNTLYRCLHGAALHRANPDSLILLSGGLIDGEGSPTAATVMREFMRSQGVEASRILLEERSQDTYENAVESCKLLRERGVRRIVLVTDASHMLRASACFRKQGMEVTPSPCGHIANGYGFDWRDVFPDVNSAVQVDTAWHEWLGMALYWVRGRL
jgi:uncharacterized SAM-binding protein YcdF (DUF218 family)